MKDIISITISLCCLLQIILLNSCNVKNEKGYNVYETIKIPETVTEISCKFIDLFTDSSLTILPLTSDIGIITKSIILNDYMYILSKDGVNADSKITKYCLKDRSISVCKFEERGDVLHEVIDICEYNKDIFCFVKKLGVYKLTNDNTFKSVTSRRNFMLFSTSAYFQTTEKLNYFIGFSREGNLLITDKNNKIISKYFKSYSNNMNRVIINPLMIDENRILYRKFLNDTIYDITNGKLKPYLYIDFEQKYPSKLFKHTLSRRQFNQIIESKRLSVIRSFYINEKSIIIEFKKDNLIYNVFHNLNTDSTTLLRKHDIVYKIKSNNEYIYIIGTYKNKFIFAVEASSENKKKELNSLEENSYPFILIGELK